MFIYKLSLELTSLGYVFQNSLRYEESLTVGATFLQLITRAR